MSSRSPTPRKAPRCRKCNQPMRGHNKVACDNDPIDIISNTTSRASSVRYVGRHSLDSAFRRKSEPRDSSPLPYPKNFPILGMDEEDVKPGFLPNVTFNKLDGDKLPSLGSPLVQVYNVQHLPVSTVRSIGSSLGFPFGTFGSPGKNENFLVVGTDPHLVKRITYTQRGVAMPGVVASEKDLGSVPKVVSYFQLVFLGVVAGLVVWYMLSMMD